MDSNQCCLIIPDIHNKVALVDSIRHRHPGVPAIFLGDYFDDYDDGPEQMTTTCEWLQRALANQEDQFLLGNHCFAYVSYEMGVIQEYCGGWNRAKQQIFHRYFPGDTLLQLTDWMVECQGRLLSHAGVTSGLYRTFSKRKNPADIGEWLDMGERALREGVAHPAFVAGRERGGQYNFGGVLWCDWDRLTPIKGVRQIVGHTAGECVRWKRENVCLDTGLRHYGLLEGGRLSVREVG